MRSRRSVLVPRFQSFSLTLVADNTINEDSAGLSFIECHPTYSKEDRSRIKQAAMRHVHKRKHRQRAITRSVGKAHTSPTVRDIDFFCNGAAADTQGQPFRSHPGQPCEQPSRNLDVPQQSQFLSPSILVQTVSKFGAHRIHTF